MEGKEEASSEQTCGIHPLPLSTGRCEKTSQKGELKGDRQLGPPTRLASLQGRANMGAMPRWEEPWKSHKQQLLCDPPPSMESVDGCATGWWDWDGRLKLGSRTASSDRCADKVPGSHTKGRTELAVEWNCPNASPALHLGFLFC